MATSASERTDGEAINEVVRNCGSLAIQCSDVAGYVAGVNERISRNGEPIYRLRRVRTHNNVPLMTEESTVSQALRLEQLPKLAGYARVMRRAYEEAVAIGA